MIFPVEVLNQIASNAPKLYGAIVAGADLMNNALPITVENDNSPKSSIFEGTIVGAAAGLIFSLALNRRWNTADRAEGLIENNRTGEVLMAIAGTVAGGLAGGFFDRIITAYF